MSVRSGIAQQFGFVTEATVGVPSTPTVFLPLAGDASLVGHRERIESAGIVAGRRVLMSKQWVEGAHVVGGDIPLELNLKGMGVVFDHVFGTHTGAGPYAYSPADLTGLSFTGQFGLPDTGGTVNPLTLSGCKVASWALGLKVKEVATLGLTVVGMRSQYGSRVVADGVTATSTTVTSATAAFSNKDRFKAISGTGIPVGAYITTITSASSVVISVAATTSGAGVSLTIGTPLATASYLAPLPKPVSFQQGTVTVAGVTVPISEVTLTGDNMLTSDERLYLGSPEILEPLEKDLRAYAATITAEFTSLTQWQHVLDADEAAVVLTLGDGTDTATFTMNCRADGDPPKTSGRGLLSQPITFKPVASGADSTAIGLSITSL